MTLTTKIIMGLALIVGVGFLAFLFTVVGAVIFQAVVG